MNLSRHRLDFIIGCFVLAAAIGVTFVALAAPPISPIFPLPTATLFAFILTTSVA